MSSDSTRVVFAQKDTRDDEIHWTKQGLQRYWIGGNLEIDIER